MPAADPAQAPLTQVSERLRELTLIECAQGIGVHHWPHRARQLATLPFSPFARQMGYKLAHFNDEVGTLGLAQAATLFLHGLQVRPVVRYSQPVPATGPLLVVANHPGVYDALALFAALPREGLRLIAAERPFLRELSNLRAHFLFVEDAAHTPLTEVGAHQSRSRSRGLRQAIEHLRGGGALLHFGAGRIEPDPAFHGGPAAISEWERGTGSLARACLHAGGQVRVAMVSGVHSPRIKRSRLIRAAEARGITTLAALLQIALPQLSPVSLEIDVSAPVELLDANTERATQQLEDIARSLLPTLGNRSAS